jgi:hypothetical protein
MIFYDPSESKQGTRLPEPIVKSGVALPGLEALTGADLLLSPLLLKLDELDSKPSQIKFAKHAEAGMFIQRKTGRDVTHLITDHSEIIARMHPWCKRIAPWLLLVGSYNCNKDGALVVDGQALQWSYEAFIAALDAWQYQGTVTSNFDGGGITVLPRDIIVTPWVNRWLDKLRAPESTKILAPKQASQILTLTKDENQPWRVTLMTFPGIGEELATRIADYCGTLADSLAFISNPDHILLKQDAKFPDGFGPSKFAKAHIWLGLEIGDTEVEQLARIMEPRTGKTRKE